jgi:PQQ-dependent catabolism-associated CXXCW motif protein
MAPTKASDTAERPPDRRKLIAVAHFDMTGYSRLIGLDDTGTLQRLRKLRGELIDPAIEEHGGRIVQTGGDSLLIVFDSIDGAIRCAVKVQQQVPIYDGDQPADRAIRFRVGIDLGDAIADGTDLHGDAVNVAARLQAECPPGGICVTRPVRDHVQDRLNLPFDELGTLNLKNIARPVEAFVIRPGLPTPKATTMPVSMPDLSIAKAPRLSLVVLPFANVGGDPRDDYLADAITEDLTTDLSRLPNFLVIARHSAATYKDKPADLRRVGEELGVRYVVEGSARRLGNILRVNVQLVSTETNTHVWAGRFDQNVTELGVGQEEIVSRLRAVLGVQVSDAESARSVRERPNNPDASDLLLRGESLLRDAGPSKWQAAAALFEQALRLDPSSVGAMCSLIGTLIDAFVIPDYPTRGNEELLAQAANLAATASAIEPEGERVIRARGALLRAQGHWAEAIATLQRVIDLYPNNPSGYRLLGFTKLAVGQAEEAIGLLQRSIRVDPLSPYNRHSYARIGTCLLLLGRDEASIEWQQRALAVGAMAPPIWRAQCYLFMASAFALMERVSDARRALAEANRLWPFGTVRSLPPTMTPRGLPDPVYLMQMRHVQDGLRLTGVRDHADEDADFGVTADAVLHTDLIARTPTTVPGARAVRTSDLVSLISRLKPILIDVALDSWGRSIPGAVGLQGTGHGANFSDRVQTRFNRKIRDLTSGDLTKPIVVFCVNSERFTGYNLALRLVALGYTDVYWYRGGVEAWQTNNLSESDLTLENW